jgi:hypothetical protein
MQKLPLTLTEAQARKLMNKHPIQLKHSQLKPEHMHYLMVHPETHKRAMKSLASGKGLRVALTPEELEMSGAGFWDLLKKAGQVAANVGRFVKDKIIDSNLYQTSIKPEVRKLVDSGEAAISGVLPAPLAGVSKTLIDALGSRTGAYGLIEVPSKKRVPKPKAKAVKKVVDKSMKNLAGGSFVIG